MQLQINENSVSIFLENDLSSSSIDECKEVLTKALNTNKPIYLEGKEIDNLDTAGMQLLLSFWITARQRHLPCRWQSTSPLFLEIASLLGMKKLFDLPDS